MKIMRRLLLSFIGVTLVLSIIPAAGFASITVQADPVLFTVYSSDKLDSSGNPSNRKVVKKYTQADLDSRKLVSTAPIGYVAMNRHTGGGTWRAYASNSYVKVFALLADAGLVKAGDTNISPGGKLVVSQSAESSAETSGEATEYGKTFDYNSLSQSAWFFPAAGQQLVQSDSSGPERRYPIITLKHGAGDIELTSGYSVTQLLLNQDLGIRLLYGFTQSQYLSPTPEDHATTYFVNNPDSITLYNPSYAANTNSTVKAPTKPAAPTAKVGKKKITVTWKKAPASQKVSKYQLRYCIKGTKNWKMKTVSSSKKSLSIKKLKSGKKYQIQVRAYKVTNGKKYYSPWSKSMLSGNVK